MLALTIVGLVGTAVLGSYAIYDQRHNRRIKRLVYSKTTVPLATAFKNDEGYRVSIQVERPGEPARTFDGAYLTFVRFANFGREPIRRQDIAPANPLVVEARMDAPGEILDISVSSTSRTVTSIALGETTNSGQIATSAVTFDFLDYHDGGIIRVLSSARPRDVTLSGDIIGMRGGIVPPNQPRSRPRKVMGWIGVGLFIGAWVATVVASVLAFRWVTGAWTNAWLLVLPPLAFVLVPLLVAGIITLFEGRTKGFPPELAYPKWIQRVRPGPWAYEFDEGTETESGEVLDPGKGESP
jgi:hypothetical protein